MTLSQKLLKLRKMAGLSQEEFAEQVGVSRQAVSRWEQGSALPDSFNLARICSVLNVSADILINDGIDLPAPAAPCDGSAGSGEAENGTVSSDVAMPRADEEKTIVVAIVDPAQAGTADKTVVPTEESAIKKKSRGTVLLACMHIIVLLLEVYSVACFLLGNSFLFVCFLGAGIGLTVISVVIFEIIVSFRDRDIRTYMRMKYYRISVWLFMLVPILVIVTGVYYAFYIVAFGYIVDILGTSTMSFSLIVIFTLIIYFAVCFIVNLSFSGRHKT